MEHTHNGFYEELDELQKMVQMILDSLRIFVSVFAIFMGINLVHMIFYMDIVQRLRHCFIKNMDILFTRSRKRTEIIFIVSAPLSGTG